MSFGDSRIMLNQSDYVGDFWCAKCEEESSKDDGYGAAVLIHETIGRIEYLKGRKVDWKNFSLIDYEKFKRFVMSILIRDHLARELKGRQPILTEGEFELVRDVYNGRHDDVFITGSYIEDSDPLAHGVSPPVRSRENDGVNYQLFNFCFLVYFNRTKRELDAIALKQTGEMRFAVVSAANIGSLKDFASEYEKIVQNPKNQGHLVRIRKKSSDDSSNG